MIKIRYFGSLKDVSGIAEEQIVWQGGTIDDLLVLLRQRSEDWYAALSNSNIFRVAVNQQIIYKPIALKQGDEVAILPPVTGG